MLSYFPVTFKTKPFLKKYLISLYGEKPFFSNDDYFGMAIAAALENPKKMYADRKNEYFTTQFKRFTTEVTIFLPVYWLKKSMYGITITEDKLCFVNDFIEKRMEEELFMLANFYSNVASLQFKDAITDFCNTHNIELEEDISYDGMKKKFYRNRQRRGIVKAKPVKCNLEAVQISAIL